MAKLKIRSNGSVSSYKIIDTLAQVSVLLLQATNFCSRVIYLSPHINLLRISSIMIMSFCLILKYKKRVLSTKGVIIILLMVMGSMFSLLATNDYLFCYIVLLMALYMGDSFKKIIKIDYITKMTILIFVLVNYWLGLTNQQMFYREGVVRETFGFTHPNILGYILISIVSDIMVLHQKTSGRNIVKAASAAVASIAVSFLAGARSASLTISLLLLNYILVRKKDRHKRKPFLFAIIPFALVGFSIFSTALYKTGTTEFIKLNDLLSDRLRYQYVYENAYEVNLMGRAISYENIPLDNGYYRVVYSYGIIGLFTIMGLLSISLYKAEKNNLTILRNIIILYLVYAFSEWYPLRLSTTPFGFIAISDIPNPKINQSIDEKEINKT